MRFIFKIMSLIFFFVGELRVDGVLRSPPPASKCLDYEKDSPFG